MTIFLNRRRLIILAVLYAATWVGGWITYDREFRADAKQRYDAMVDAHRRMADLGQEPDWLPPNKNGPTARVDWCVPLLPGVLLADSTRSLAPLAGNGGVRLVLYYGFGTMEVLKLWGWIS